MTPDLSALTTAFVTFGGKIFRKNVNEMSANGPGVLVYKNVKAPIALPKLSAIGGPRPYRSQDDVADAVKIEDRILTVYQSKWDFDVDLEKFRNTYLATAPATPFYQYIIDQVSNEYLAQLNDITAYSGVYNAAGTGPADIATGWGTILAAEITGLKLTPIVTGAITAANAVAKVELVSKSVPVWMRKKGFEIWCSYAVMDAYISNYRTVNNFSYNAANQDNLPLDGVNGKLVAKTFMGTSSRLIATPVNNLVMGTDGDSIQVAATARRNIIEVRLMMPVGFQISDLEALKVNDMA